MALHSCAYTECTSFNTQLSHTIQKVNIAIGEQNIYISINTKWHFKYMGGGGEDVDWIHFPFLSSFEFCDKSVYSTKDGELH
jgi:hypothetical protein